VLLCGRVAEAGVPIEATRSLLDSLAKPFRVEAQDIYISASAGVALGHKHRSPQELLSAADAARFRAKTSGHKLELSNRTSVHEARETLSLKAALSEAIQRDELDVAFQPVVATTSGAVEFVEALCRWNRSDGAVSPGVFIPMAEQTGLIQHRQHLVLFNVIADLNQQLVRILVRQTIAKPLVGALTGEGGLFGGLFGNAKGNAFRGGSVVPFAKGGVVTGPTIFPMANGAGLMGEAGPEAVLPLRRGPGGRLGVEAVGAGGGTKVFVNVVNNTPSEVSIQESQEGDSTRLLVMVDQATAKNITNDRSATYQALRRSHRTSPSRTRR